MTEISFRPFQFIENFILGQQFDFPANFYSIEKNFEQKKFINPQNIILLNRNYDSRKPLCGEYAIINQSSGDLKIFSKPFLIIEKVAEKIEMSV